MTDTRYGFGVLSESDVRESRELDAEFRRHSTLGARKPWRAKRARGLRRAIRSFAERELGS